MWIFGWLRCSTKGEGGHSSGEVEKFREVPSDFHTPSNPGGRIPLALLPLLFAFLAFSLHFFLCPVLLFFFFSFWQYCAFVLFFSSVSILLLHSFPRDPPPPRLVLKPTRAGFPPHPLPFPSPYPRCSNLPPSSCCRFTSFVVVCVFFCCVPSLSVFVRTRHRSVARERPPSSSSLHPFSPHNTHPVCPK